MKKFFVINGPNLNLLGKREPDKYGNLSLESLERLIKERFPEIEFEFFQSNVEGELINQIHKCGEDKASGLILNPGGFSHNSVSIHDAIKALDAPAVEVHLTNLSTRENFRQNLMTGSACLSIIQGGGAEAYLSAVFLLIASDK